MTIPLGEDVELPVTVVLLGDPVAVLQATLVRLEAEAFHLRADPAIEVGRRLVASAATLKLSGQVFALHGATAHVRRAAVHGTDDRAAPRVFAPRSLRWRSGDRWADAAIADLSVAGVRFTASTPAPPLGERVEFALRLGAAVHAIRGLVRRSEATPAGCEVAAEFAEMSDDASDAIADLTLRSL